MLFHVPCEEQLSLPREEHMWATCCSMFRVWALCTTSKLLSVSFYCFLLKENNKNILADKKHDKKYKVSSNITNCSKTLTHVYNRNLLISCVSLNHTVLACNFTFKFSKYWNNSSVWPTKASYVCMVFQNDPYKNRSTFSKKPICCSKYQL